MTCPKSQIVALLKHLALIDVILPWQQRISGVPELLNPQQWDVVTILKLYFLKRDPKSVSRRRRKKGQIAIDFISQTERYFRNINFPLEQGKTFGREYKIETGYCVDYYLSL